MDNNVVPFPKGKRNSPPQSLSEILSSVEDIRTEHMSMIAENIMEFVIYRLHEEGFDISKPQCIVPIAYMNEAMKSAMLASIGKDHPIQHAANDFFNSENEAE